MLVSRMRLLQLVQEGVIKNALVDNINGTSINVTLDPVVLVEEGSISYAPQTIDLSASLLDERGIATRGYDLRRKPFPIQPGQFFMGTTREMFNLPDYILAQFHISPEYATNGLMCLNSGFIESNTNEKLRLNFKNLTRYHGHLLTDGMIIGKVTLHEYDHIPSGGK